MIILTGGAGFIGSAFLAYLNSKGINDVLVVDALRHADKWKNLRGKKFLDYQHKDAFLNWFGVKENKRNVTALIHLGACSSTTEKDVDYLFRNNVDYSRTVVQSALSANIRCLYASSGATYGAGEHGYSDAHAIIDKLRPLNPYGFSKQVFDQWVMSQGLLDKCCGLKFFNVYGPNEYHKLGQYSVVYTAYQQILTSSKVKLFKSYKADYKDGEQKRDFVYVKDLCEIMYWLIQNPKVNGIYNLGSGVARTFNDLAKSVFSALGKSPNIDYVEMPEGLRGQYQYHTQADMKKIFDAGYHKPMSSLEEGVKDYVTGYLTQQSGGKEYW